LIVCPLPNANFEGYFSTASHYYTRSQIANLSPPSGERPRLKKQAVEIIEAHFKDYKSQINNRIAGTGRPTKVGVEIGVRL